MQNIREWREGSITKATVVYEIPIVYSYGSDLHPIRNQLLWQTTKKRSILINHAWKTNKPSFLWSILADFQWKVCTASNIAIWHLCNQKKSENETLLDISNHDTLKLDLDLDFGAPQKINLKFYHNLQFQIVEQTGEPYAKIRK